MFSCNLPTWGAGIAQWFERRTRDRRVSGSSPGRSGGGILFSRSAICADSYFGIRFTAVAHKKYAKGVGGRLQNACTHVALYELSDRM